MARSIVRFAVAYTREDAVLCSVIRNLLVDPEKKLFFIMGSKIFPD